MTCEICSKILSTKKAKRCQQHRFVGNHPYNWKGGNKSYNLGCKCEVCKKSVVNGYRRCRFHRITKDSTREKISLSVRKRVASGLHNNYKGGISSVSRTERNNFMQTSEYQTWRKTILERDGYKCQMPLCGRGGYLNVNLILRYADYPLYRLAIKNGITLCRPCHTSIYNKEERFEKMFLLTTK